MAKKWNAAEEGSIEHFADAETRKKIAEGRREAREDAAAVDRWARNGSQAVNSKPDRGWEGDSGELPPRRATRR